MTNYLGGSYVAKTIREEQAGFRLSRSRTATYIAAGFHQKQKHCGHFYRSKCWLMTLSRDTRYNPIRQITGRDFIRLINSMLAMRTFVVEVVVVANGEKARLVPHKFLTTGFHKVQLLLHL